MVAWQPLSSFARYGPPFWENLSSFRAKLASLPASDPLSAPLEAQILARSLPLPSVLLEARGCLCRVNLIRESVQSIQEHLCSTGKLPKSPDQGHSLPFVAPYSALESSELAMACCCQHYCVVAIMSPSLAMSQQLCAVAKCWRCASQRPLSSPFDGPGGQSAR